MVDDAKSCVMVVLDDFGDVALELIEKPLSSRAPTHILKFN